jgi:multidrug efflux system membrane fusion protein
MSSTRRRYARTRPALPLLLAAALAGLAGCSGKAQRGAPRVAVTVAPVERRDMPITILASGTVEPVQSADVGSQVGGVVRRIAIREGQDVEAGQVLIELDARPFRDALALARGNLARDLAQWRSAQLDADRADKMLEQSLISPAEHDRTTAAAEALHGTVRADSATVATARLNLEFASIRAPFAGRAGKLNVHVGDLVKAATSEPLVTVNRTRPILVRFAIAQDDLPKLPRDRTDGLRVFVRTSPSDSIEAEGRLTFVDNAVDPSSGTLLLKGEFSNRDGRLWPGAFVEVRLVVAMQKGVTVVPAPAVANGQQGTYVYVLNPDSTASSRPVTVLRSDDVTAIIASGLSPGEVVVTDGQFRIGPGARLMVRQPAGGKRH